MTFRPGSVKPPTSGRRPGTPNKSTRAIRDVLVSVLSDPECEDRLRALRDSPEAADRSTFWRIASRLIPNEVSAAAGAVEVIHKIRLGPPPDEPALDLRAAPRDLVAPENHAPALAGAPPAAPPEPPQPEPPARPAWTISRPWLDRSQADAILD